jgi:hypothetical protein
MNEDFNPSRRGLLQTGLTILAATAMVAAAGTARAQDDDKVEQETVLYQSTPKDGQQCSSCVNFVAPNQCKVVKGVVAATGWCNAYAPIEAGK